MKHLFVLLMLITAHTGMRSQVMDSVPEQLVVELAAEQLVDWEEFKSYYGRFRVLIPGGLTEKVDSIETDIGTLAYHTFFYQSNGKDADNLFYMISYCDYPEYTVHSDSIELLPDFFEATIESAVASMHGELLYANEIALKNYPGRIWRIDYLGGKAIVKTKAYMVGRRYYAIQTISKKKHTLNLSGDRFMESFRLLE